MKLFMAGLATETNTFSPMPTGLESFREMLLSDGGGTSMPANLFSSPLHTWRELAAIEGVDVVEGLCACAEPAGLTIRRVYEDFRNRILDGARQAMPCEMILLSLHGSMVADGYDDCEGDLLECLRAIVGPEVIIGVEIDPHASLTETMLANASFIVAYKEYPHDDALDRAREVFAIALSAARGDIRPVMRDHDCRMLTLYNTKVEPMLDFVSDMKAAERREGVLSLSLVHGFPFADVERVGTRMLAVTNGNGTLAAETAQEFADKLWELREQLRLDLPDLHRGLDLALAEPAGPVVLADMADNAGGGAPSDSTFVLREILKREIRNVAVGMFWDPVTVGICSAMGVGARLRIRLGGKIGPESGDPLDLEVTVRGCLDRSEMYLGDTSFDVGASVWLEAKGVHIVVSQKRIQTFNRSAFEDLGIDLKTLRLIVVKSSNHFYSSFAEIASRIIQCATPGALNTDFTKIDYTKRKTPFWPAVQNPEPV